MRVMSLCVSIAFLCMPVYMSVCLSACLSKSLNVFFCMSVCPSLSLNICGVVPAYQGSRARYRAFQVFCWNSKSVPFPITLAVGSPLSWYLIMHYLSVTTNPSPMSKTGPDFFLIFQCSGTCPTPAQEDILVSD